MNHPALDFPPPPTALDPDRESCPFLIECYRQFVTFNVENCPNPVTAVCQLCGLRCCDPHMEASDCPESPESRHQTSRPRRMPWPTLKTFIVCFCWWALMATIALVMLREGGL